MQTHADTHRHVCICRLHKFLPSQSEAFEHYDLWQRRHNFSLPARTSHLADNNFIQRMLYHDVYWLCTFTSVHLLYIYMMPHFVGTLINTHDDDDVHTDTVKAEYFIVQMPFSSATKCQNTEWEISAAIANYSSISYMYLDQSYQTTWL